MNSGVSVGDLSRWQNCAGMCLVCGQLLGLNEKSSAGAAKKTTVAAAAAADDMGEEESWMESLSLSEECPVRLCMMRFYMLGKREECHIVDTYTHLEKEKGGLEARFDRVFNKKKDAIVAVHPAYRAFADQIITTTSAAEEGGELAIAMATCRRVAKPLTFSGCRACNLAMEKASSHANAIYRCFPVTANADVVELESNTLDSIRIKKILEQAALFFAWDGARWRAKSGERLLQDACLWRCVAHLFCWGRNAKFRSRLVCIFHAANYLFWRGTLKGSMSLESWHMHVFQPFYMRHYPATTWFGMSQGEAGAIFDFSRKDGAHWMQYITERLDTVVGPALQTWAENEIKIGDIQEFKDRFARSVTGERKLLQFVAHKEGVQKGLERLLSFYLFNISGKTDELTLLHCKRFMSEMCKTYQRLSTAVG